ncbi:hypothetical protein BJ165DRAFT_1533869 [Panaeolus papilionaceus]|nr:hypothetical protein BJ165DRAFT_1533869 [Panaeolus papilionaceus]
MALVPIVLLTGATHLALRPWYKSYNYGDHAVHSRGYSFLPPPYRENKFEDEDEDHKRQDHELVWPTGWKAMCKPGSLTLHPYSSYSPKRAYLQAPRPPVAGSDSVAKKLAARKKNPLTKRTHRKPFDPTVDNMC